MLALAVVWGGMCFLSVAWFKPNALAVREIPYLPAANAAEAHNRSGIREPTARVRRHRSNRCRTPSSPAGRLRVRLEIIGCPPNNWVLTAYDTIHIKLIHTRLPEAHAIGEWLNN
jgi:hypothetical protein